MKLTGENRSTREKTCPSVTLFTTNPTWTDPGSNPGLCDERPAANRLTHGTGSRSTSVCLSVSITNAPNSRYIHQMILDIDSIVK
jgi:hypothetical protein